MARRIRIAAPLALVLALVPVLAFAQATTQLRLSWDHCAAEGYFADRSFACDTNTGEEVLFASAVLGDEVPRVNLAAIDCYVDFRLTSSPIPPWWQVNFMMCRQNAIVLQGSELVASPLCTPWYLADGAARQALDVRGITYPPDGSSLRLQFVAAVPAGSEFTIPDGPQEYLLARVRILHSKSTGTGACAGCLVPVCIGLGQLRLQYVSPTSYFTIVGTPASTVTWQGAHVSGYAPVPGYMDGGFWHDYRANLDCASGPVPAQNRTWGVIKTMYR